MTHKRPLPFPVIALGILAILLTLGAASLSTTVAGAAPIVGDGTGRAQAAPTFTPISTPLPKGDPAAGRVIDRQVWLEHALSATIFTILIWGVVAAVIIGIVATGKLKGPVVPGRSDVDTPRG